MSLFPVLAGGQHIGHERLFWEWAGNRAIREGRWKLCWDKKFGRWELYDVVADRTETKDLAHQHPDRVREMSSEWMQWASDTGAKRLQAGE